VSQTITIAVDGHSSTGKSTLARQLAKELGYVYVDSGAMYRCVALFAMKSNFYNGTLNRNQLLDALPKINISFELDPESRQNQAVLNGEVVEGEIRGMDVSEKVSEIAAIPEVRKKLVEMQQALGANKGVVMDGRDIGTVVFPDAELKIFMTARPETRAKRRFEELKAKGMDVSFDEVLANLNKRDQDDTNRADSPLLQASDALILDNSDITLEEQFDLALKWAKEKIG
jgi:cytidylate kinase